MNIKEIDIEKVLQLFKTNESRKFSISSDPEFFMLDKALNPVSAIDRIGGDKYNPLAMEVGEGFIQEDNLAVEINPLPAFSLSDFIHNQVKSYKGMERIVNNLGYTVSPDTVVEFSRESLQDPRVLISGCSRDMNAYSGRYNPAVNLSSTRLRAVGGHVHICFLDKGIQIDNKEALLAREILVKALDITLGVPSVMIDNDRDRRKLYGKAGAYRVKSIDNGDPYNGVEYRVLSSFWLLQDNYSWLYAGVQRAFRLAPILLQRQATPETEKIKEIRKMEQITRAAVNKYDMKKSKQIIDYYLPLAA